MLIYRNKFQHCIYSEQFGGDISYRYLVSTQIGGFIHKIIPDIWQCNYSKMLRYMRNVMMTSSNGNIFRITGPLCGEFTGPGEFPTQRPVTRSFDAFFDLRLNKPLNKQPWGWWFETLSRSLWRHRNVVAEVNIKGRDKYLHPTDTVGCNYLSLPLIPSSGIILLIYSTCHEICTRVCLWHCFVVVIHRAH